MRPAIEVWRDALDATGALIRFRDKPEQKAAAVIEADRAELVREIAAWLPQQPPHLSLQEYAQAIQAKFGGRDGE